MLGHGPATGIAGAVPDLGREWPGRRQAALTAARGRGCCGPGRRRDADLSYVRLRAGEAPTRSGVPPKIKALPVVTENELAELPFPESPLRAPGLPGPAHSRLVSQERPYARAMSDPRRYPVHTRSGSLSARTKSGPESPYIGNMRI